MIRKIVFFSFFGAVLKMNSSCEKKNVTADKLEVSSENTAADSAQISSSEISSSNSATANEVPQTVNGVNAQLQQVPPQTVTVNNQPAVQNTGKKPAVNPPHGQPWHRCDIAVGAPIDSPPQKPTTPAGQNSANQNFNTNPIQVNPAAPVNTNTTAQNNTGPKPATNPAHGQPWHRCDLQVGDPLP